MVKARVSAAGQITLPDEVLEALALQRGGDVMFVVDQEKVVIKPMASGGARALAGSLRRYATSKESPARVRDLVSDEVARAAAQEG